MLYSDFVSCKKAINAKTNRIRKNFFSQRSFFTDFYLQLLSKVGTVRLLLDRTLIIMASPKSVFIIT